MRPAVLAVAPVLALVLAAGSCDDGPSGVTVGQVGTGTVDEIVEASGTVTARAAATLASPANGTLADLRVADGDTVRKGDVVAVIDSPDLVAREKSAARALDAVQRTGVSSPSGIGTARRTTDAQADAAFAQARQAASQISDPTVQAALLQQVALAQQQYRAASAAAAAAVTAVNDGVASLGSALGSLSAAQRLQAQQAYDLAAAAVDALTLKAPVGGVIQLGGGVTPASALTATSVDSAVPQGGYVTAGTPLMTVVDVGRLGLTAQVDETDVLLVKPGVGATVELDAAPGDTYTATVRSVALLPTTSATGGVSYRIRLDLHSSAAPTPRPGMSAVVRLDVRRAADAITVPAAAVMDDGGHQTVWAVRDGRYRRTGITLGVEGEDEVQVTAGLEPGQKVVVAGADKVHDGDAVRQ